MSRFSPLPEIVMICLAFAALVSITTSFPPPLEDEQCVLDSGPPEDESCGVSE